MLDSCQCVSGMVTSNVLLLPGGEVRACGVVDDHPRMESKQGREPARNNSRNQSIFPGNGNIVKMRIRYIDQMGYSTGG